MQLACGLEQTHTMEKMKQVTLQHSLKPRAKLGRAQQQKLYHQHAEIRQKQKLYKEHIESLKLAQKVPESLYAKRKRACAEFMESEAPIAVLWAFGKEKHLAMSVDPDCKTSGIVVELVQELEAMADVDHNFIMQDIAKLGQKGGAQKDTTFS